MDHTSAAGTQGMIGALRRVLESAGGFTLHHGTGEHTHHGLSVCADPAATLTFPPGAWDDEQVDTWFHTWADRLAGSDLHLGGWLDPATQCVSLDVARVYPAGSTTRRGAPRAEASAARRIRPGAGRGAGDGCSTRSLGRVTTT